LTNILKLRPLVVSRLIALLLAVVSCCAGLACAATPVSADTPPDRPLGLYATYYKESGAGLKIGEIIAAYRNGIFHPGNSPALNFGIGSGPVWIGLDVENTSNLELPRRLSIETPWLDKVDVYIVAGNSIVASYKLGDAQPFAQRPIRNRFFEMDQTFAPGTSTVLIRVQTHDPMVVPIYLRSISAAKDHDTWLNYSYGFVYGFLLALLAYNAMLYIGLRSRRYILYSLYLAVFLLLNIAYTGHGFAWLWPDQVRLQLWIIPFLMALFGMSGLLFASSFLDTRSNFPSMHRAIIWICAAFGSLLLALFLFDYNSIHMAVAFVFVIVFSVLMLLLGVRAVRSGYTPAWYFLFAAISSMTGAALTDLSVAGVISYNAFTYRAVEIGMLMDAVLLALALAYQFRVNQREKLLAERMARIDALTGLNNRRAFYEFTKPIWSNALRNRRDVSVILFDMDHFKRINDSYGHDAGDRVLIAIASLIMQSAREGDVAARWGGEEFILFLPETNLEAATVMAERLRTAISEKQIKHAKGKISFTASFGVAQRPDSCESIEELTTIADKCLFLSKHKGRNRVSHTFEDIVS
jgi:diguanylate cyclase (GGDEF)-like protein